MTKSRKRRLAPIPVQSVGEPMEFGGFARLILHALDNLPTLKPVTEPNDEQPGRCVPEVEQRP